MTIPALNLDDLTWQDLRDLAVKRIPAVSGGRWTHHSPVDSGITFLELFAFLMEQQIFVLDQVPDDLIRALLSLLGDAPKPAGVATTVLAAEWQEAVSFAVVGVATEARPQPTSLSHLKFSLTGKIAILPVSDIRLLVDGDDKSQLIAEARPVTLLSRLGDVGRIEFQLILSGPLPPALEGSNIAVALLLEDDIVPPAWSDDAVDVSPPSSFRWSYLNGVGVTHDFPEADISDGTGGLRRSGTIEVTVPAAWVGETLLRFELATENITHSASPILGSLIANAFVIQNKVQRTVSGLTPDGGPLDSARKAIAEQLLNWLPHSGLKLELPEILSPPLEGGLKLSLKDGNDDPHEWSAISDLATSGPADRVFTMDRTLRSFFFGDGYRGRVPAPTKDFALELEIGGGPEGNLAAGLVWRLQSDEVDVPGLENYRLANITDGTGGAEPETLESARRRVASALSTRRRAVTRDDYVTLVNTTPGIGPHRAHVVPGYHPAFPCDYVGDAVTIFVVPRLTRGPSAPQMDPGARRAIVERLDEARLITTQVFVVRPVYRPVWLQVTVQSGASATNDLQAELHAAYIHWFDPNAGGPKGTGWPFGHPLRPSELVRVGDAALAERGFIEAVAVSLDGNGAFESCTDTAIGPNDLVTLAGIQIIRMRAADGGSVL